MPTAPERRRCYRSSFSGGTSFLRVGRFAPRFSGFTPCSYGYYGYAPRRYGYYGYGPAWRGYGAWRGYAHQRRYSDRKAVGWRLPAACSLASTLPAAHSTLLPSSIKAQRVANFHRETVKALAELVAAAGLDHPSQLRPHHFLRRVAADGILTFAETYRFLKPGELLSGTSDARFAEAWAMARADSFAPADTVAAVMHQAAE
jgi:hypothetical protein